MADVRGLVISCPIVIGDRSLKIITSALDPQELRFSLLFWEKLNFPTNNFLHIELDPDTQFLADQGILSRTQFTPELINGMGNLESLFIQAHTHAFRSLDQKEPGVWSLATGENSISFPQNELEEGRGILLRLHRAIPVPNKDVPLADILEFRNRRRSELLALRYHLESIYQRILSAGDGELALNSEVNNLQNAIVDHIKTSKESGLTFRNLSFSANLNLVPAALAGIASISTGLPLVSTILNIATASIDIGLGPSLKGGKASKTPFRYVSSYYEQVF